MLAYLICIYLNCHNLIYDLRNFHAFEILHSSSALKTATSNEKILIQNGTLASVKNRLQIESIKN